MSASSAALPPVSHELAESRFLLNVDGPVLAVTAA